MLGAVKKWGRKLRYEPQYFRQQIGGLFALTLILLASPVWWQFLVGAPVVALGAVVRMWAAGHLNKDDELGTKGPYAFMRHPQYFGNSCIAIGLSIASGHLVGILVYAAIFYIFYRPAIREEDQKLREKFGEKCREWQEEVPAVVPTLSPASNPGLHLRNWSPRQALKNGEPVWTTSLGIGLTIIYLYLPTGKNQVSMMADTLDVAHLLGV